MTTPIILVEVQPSRPADGVAEMVRLAGGGALQYTYLGQTDWRAGITALPTFITSLTFEGGEIGLGGVPSAAQIEWAPAGNLPLATLAGYYWTDAPIAVRIGPEGSDPPIVLNGTVLEATADGGVLKIALADPAASIKKPFPVDRFAGTGGLEGPAEWEGLFRRRVWGRIWNQPGQPIDKANNIYCFADPLRPIQAIDAVRDKGASAAALTTLAPVGFGAGSAAATFAALQAAAAPAGGGVICPSLACVKWWTQPAGDLTADLKGEIGAGYVETVPEIAARVVAAAGGPAFVAGTVGAAAVARPGPAGWAVRDDNTSTSAMLDDLLGAVSLLWLLGNAGTIVIREWAWSASAATARSVSVTRKRGFKPLATRKLGFKRNELPMARGDIAGIVFDAAYADGTPIEALKPAEAAADVTLTAQVVTSNPASVAVTADISGTVTGGLPRVLTPTVSKGGADLRIDALATYAVANLTGGCAGNVTVENTAGSADKGRQTITTGLTASGTYDLVITFDGVAQPAHRVTVTKTSADAPSGGSSGGGSAKSGSFDPTGASVTSVTLTEIGRVSGLVKAPGETIRAYFPADYETSASANAIRKMSAQWQYSVAGAGSWTAFGTAVDGSFSSFVAYEASAGSITCNQTAAPADGTYDIRLVAAENSVTNSSVLTVIGGTAYVEVGP